MKSDEKVGAFTGLYPFFGGYGNLEILFTRHRILIRTGTEISVWTAATGMVAVRKIATFPATGLAIERLNERRGRDGQYDQISLAGKRYWTHRDDRATVQSWVRVLLLA